MKDQRLDQQAMPVFTAADEGTLAAQSTIRFAAFLREELEILPPWHRLYPIYQAQLKGLQSPLRPRALR